MQMMAGTGEIFRRLQMARATGAIISTVATLSTKAEISPAKSERARTIHLTELTRAMMKSLSCIGMRESMKR